MHERSGNVRWAFCVSKWRPGQEDWESVLKAVQPEEATRVQKFIYQKDSKSSVAGRLLLRRAVCSELGIPWTDIRLERTNRGKPFLANEVEGADSLSFNVSHHGDYAVLAASTTHKIGVDVMKIEWPKGDDDPIERLFSLMSDQFTAYEWQCIRNNLDEWDQLQMFHRLWSLKESYVKAIGCGLNIDLQTIEFHTETDLVRGKYTKDTKLYVNDRLQENWCFEETMLDNKHTVATAIWIQGDNFTSEDIECKKFQILSPSKLMDKAAPLGHTIEPESWQMFKSSCQKPGRRS